MTLGLQTWSELAFFHWALPPEAVRPLVDPRLELDLFEGRAWVGLVPFTLNAARVRGLPPLPRFRQFHELNARTYVRCGGAPGVWFFSLDAASGPAAAVARAAFGLPYHRASIGRSSERDRFRYSSRRTWPSAPATFEATWSVGAPLAPYELGSREHFLVHRLALYSRDFRGKLLRGVVEHPRWPLRVARLEHLTETVSRAAGLPPLIGEPLAHHSAGVNVEILRFEHV